MNYPASRTQGFLERNINEGSNKIYIGQTINFNKRFKQHLNTLKLNKHINTDLQEDFNNKDKLKFIPIKNYVKNSLNKMEKFWIKKYNTYIGFGYNKTIGGDNYGIGKDNPKYDHKLYTFYHWDGRKEKDITRFNFMKKYKLSNSNLSCTISGKQESVKGWSIIKPIDYTFYYKDKLVEKNVTQKYMKNKYKLQYSQLSRVLRGELNSTKGWRVNKEIIDYRENKNKYTFYHKDGLVEKDITIQEMASKYNLKSENISQIIYDKNKMIKNWTLNKNYKDNRLDETEYTFYHFNGSIEKNVTQNYMKKKYNLKDLDKLINGKQKSNNGWVIDENNLLKLYSFENKDGRIEKNISRNEMMKKYNLPSSNLSKVIKGTQKFVHNWTMNKLLLNEKIIRTTYSFKHKSGVSIGNISINKMKTKYNLSNNIHKLVTKELKELNGWIIVS